MSRALVEVEVYDSDTGTVTRESFRVSPVRIGSASWNGLRLRDRDVAPVHGQIWFDERRLWFGNLAAKTWLDGRPVARGSIVPLGRASVLMIGPFRLELTRTMTDDRPEPNGVHDEASAFFQWSSADDPTVPDLSLDVWPISSTELTARGIANVAALAGMLLRLRRLGVLPTAGAAATFGAAATAGTATAGAAATDGTAATTGAGATARTAPPPDAAVGATPGHRPAGPTLADLDDVDDIMSYLLDPEGPPARLGELRAELAALVRWVEATTSFGKRGLA